jgi:hypothetical protein
VVKYSFYFNVGTPIPQLSSCQKIINTYLGPILDYLILL